MTRTIVCVVGARPNFMKIAPILRAIAAHPGLRAVLVHTGQHYGSDMSDSFFDELGIQAPDVNLEVGSGTHAQQTAEIMQRFEPVLDAQPVDAVLVVGDVNSTIACALVAAKKGIVVVHVEAGLRSFDRAMPEEINRVLTDQISDLLYTTEAEALGNLVREGVEAHRVVFVGNVMIDTLRHSLGNAVPAAETVGRDVGDYALLTLHRPSNVDDPAVLEPLLTAIAAIAKRLPVIFPIHPRTANSIRAHKLDHLLAGMVTLPPVSYLSILGLMQSAKLVMTDSGGLQEESTALGIPCLTLRENTERPVTVSQGSNTIVGSQPQAVLAAFEEVMAGRGKAGRIPQLWDGRAAERIVAHLAGWLERRGI